jgi:aminoglycoside/choline kinase family phosphotransferase
LDYLILSFPNFKFQDFMPKNTLAGDPFAEPRFDEPYLAEIVHKALNRPVAQVGFSPLQGDASTRQYYRLSLDGASEPQTLILMQLEAPNVPGETDFIRVLKFLKGIHLPVPELFHFDAERGLLLLQDCGDTTLETHLHSADPATLKSGYLKAVHLLADMQRKATQAIDEDCPAYHLKFDVEKLMWEMDFMLEHFIEGIQQNKLKAATRKEIRKQLAALCTDLAGQPPCFTHRDYHSRNLMVHNNELVLIDFQDARMGPSQYDLASLLRDSYLPLPDTLVWELVDAFIQKIQEQEIRTIDREEFIRVFDLMSIQRNLKAIGTFAYQKKIKNNDRYMRYITPTLEYIRQAFMRRPELKPLQIVLSETIPEL